MAQVVEGNFRKLRVRVAPMPIPLCQNVRRDGRAIFQPEQLPAVFDIGLAWRLRLTSAFQATPEVPL